MASYADECPYLNKVSYFFSNDYYCVEGNREKRIDYDRAMGRCSRYNYTDCPIYRNSSRGSSGCFITTITCNILGKKDDDRVMNILRKFRDDILQNDQKYYDDLREYDTIGVIVANAISCDSNARNIASDIYNNYFEKVCKYYEDKKYDEAVFLYKQLTMGLVGYYGLEDEYNEAVWTNYYGYSNTKELLGHGRSNIRVKTKIK